jgi:hypothetical protein
LEKGSGDGCGCVVRPRRARNRLRHHRTERGVNLKMGDKGGKKDKAKHDKQKSMKDAQKMKDKEAKVSKPE